ncbi:uncharacterized protein K02A2.6-like [Ornithodoros turicata]|uniref:uncharacterized protein K02A2.6-like n=1 Tax=Ornithodoros turicata TaxID=34597 RepID=UPI003138E777
MTESQPPLTIETDHKPTESIARKPLSKAPPRLQRLLLDVQQYALTITYKKGTELVTADLLSRDCVNVETTEECTSDLQVMAIVLMAQETWEELKRNFARDEDFQAVVKLVTEGWPNNTHELTEPTKLYWSFRDELSVYEGVLFRGDRLVIPKSWRGRLLKQIHMGHSGINSCLKRARETVYWPGMSSNIKDHVERCSSCQETERMPQREPLHMKEVPSLPWERVATDLCSFEGQTYIVIVDSYSGYLDFKALPQAAHNIGPILAGHWRNGSHIGPV